MTNVQRLLGAMLITPEHVVEIPGCGGVGALSLDEPRTHDECRPAAEMMDDLQRLWRLPRDLQMRMQRDYVAKMRGRFHRVEDWWVFKTISDLTLAGKPIDVISIRDAIPADVGFSVVVYLAMLTDGLPAGEDLLELFYLAFPRRRA